MEAMETGDGRRHPAADEVRLAETEDTGTEALAKGGSSLPNQSEESKFELKDIETPLVPCRMEPLNASPSHSEDETEEGGLASEKDDDDVEDVEEMEATPVQVKDSDPEETIGKGTCSASFSLDEMMDIGTVDQQEQEAQMCTDDNNSTTVLEEEEEEEEAAQNELDTDMKPNVGMKVDEEVQKKEEKEEEKKEDGSVEEVKEKEMEEVTEKEVEEVTEKEVEEVTEKEREEVNEKEREEENEKEREEENEKEREQVNEKEREEEENEKEREEAKEKVGEDVKEQQQQEEEEVNENNERIEEEKGEKEEESVPFYATRSRSRAATTSVSPSTSDMTNGMKVIKLSASSSSSSSSPAPIAGSPTPIKIKDEPEDEEYELALVSGTSTVKDEPVAAKEEDLQIESVYSVMPDGSGRRQRGRPSSSSSTLNMLCAHCQKGLLKGQTAYQRKGSPALFCSTGCLTSSLSSSKSVKTCHRCQKRISRPQDIILAPDVDGLMRGFCSEPCLSAFTLNKSADAKALASSDVKLQSVCSMCAKYDISKHEVVLSGVVHKMCSDSCFKLFRTANQLTMAGCANCGSICHVRPLLLKMEGSSKTLCNLDCLIKYKKKVKMNLPCAMCRSPRPLADMFHNKSNTDDSVSLYCSSSCIMAFMVQSVTSSGTHLNCENCGKNALPAYHLAMSDTTIRNFCTLPCVMAFQEKFKMKQKQMTIFPKLPVASSQEPSTTPPLPQAASATLDCAQCARQMTAKPDVIHVKDKVVFVCSWSCALEFKTSKNISAKCEYCKMDKISREVKRINGKDCSFCSHGCKLLYEHDLDARWGKHCKSCSYCQCVSKKVEKALYGESSEEFCSEVCRSNYTMLFCHVAKCTSCGRKGKLKHSLFMLGELRNFCDLPCLFHFCNGQIKTQGDVFPPDSPVIANVVSLACQDQASRATPDKPTKQTGDYQISLRKRKEDSLTSTGPRTRGSDSQTDPDLIIINDSPERKRPSPSTPTPISVSTSRSMKNKALLCKPLVQNKGVSCRTQTVDVEAQTDLSIPKVMVLPIPVPVYVPVPMNMYSQCTPNPVGVPLPLPVPMLLPVNMDNADRIVETIKKIKEKFPADPFEAELVLMAEMVSETNGGDGATDKEGEMRPEIAAGGDAMSTDLNTDDLASLLNSWDEPNAPSPPMDVETDFPIETLERMALQRESSTPPASPAPTGTRKRQPSRKSRETRGRKKSNKGAEVSGKKGSAAKSSVPKVPKLKSEYGVDAWKRWIRWRDAQPDMETPRIGMRPLVPKEDLLRCTSAELSYGLCRFITEVKRPSGEPYAADSLFYLCLGIQQHLFENGRVENIFTDSFYCKFSTEFTNMLRGFQPTLTTGGYIHSRVEEEFLWDCKQLGVYSPIVLLNTLLYFFCKNFGFTTVEQHRQLSFAHVMRCTKTAQGNVKTTFLRFYPPIAPIDDLDGIPAKKRKEEEEAEVKEEKILEMKENTENPLRCPVRLYEFYLSKCSETVKQRTDVFYLLPERCCVPNSPLWFSATPLDEDTKEAMLTRILTVRQLHLATRERTLAPEDDEGGGGGRGAGDDDDDDDWP
ncbi:zinc finger MYM-type protein 4-like [Hippocampus comes]|uniref:zinc finger MYM-type protein 4-like n=1 Tax=Hippocampus comes TaxID=109280 RepID=UPI00094EF3A8|nr:PREDICTED: zinc finger MYM-type protein 4-like [Hippocampus comes]